MMIKKLTAALLAGAILTASAVSASAVSVNQNKVPSVNSTPVKGTYVANVSAETVYSVDINWGSMKFTCTVDKEGTWNPETHTYDNATPGVWSCEEGANVVTVTNHSNAQVGVSVYFKEEVRPFDGITGTFTNSEYTLKSGEGTTYEKADKKSSVLTLEGTISKDHDNDIFGSANVILSAVK